MESKAFHVSLAKNPVISIKVIPGHFTNNSIHISHYIDVSRMKSNAMIARDVAQEMAMPYLSSTIVNTIVCMERTVVIGAYLAQELLQYGASVVNSGGDIHVVAPLSNINGNLVFQESSIGWISNQNIILLVASISSGRTVDSALECLAYYGGRVVGISTLFVASPNTRKVNALFTADDIPEYRMFIPGECELCKAGQKLDAIISSEGYNKIK